MYYSQRTTLHY